MKYIVVSIRKGKSKAKHQVSESMEFNGSIEVTELLGKTLENAMKEVLIRAISICGSKYGFDSMEAIRTLGLDKVKLVKKPMAKRSVSEKRVAKEKVAKEKKQKVPLPFSKEHIDAELCGGLNYNHGLFTQCPRKRMENGNYCVKCQSEADKNASGEPNCGTIEHRGEAEFKDPKGRTPVSYIKLLEKLNITRAQAEEEAAKVGMTIDESHFIAPEPIKRGGRPKKTNKVVEADGVEDLFAKLTSDNDDDDVTDTNDVTEQPKKRVKLTEEEKAAKKAALETERQQKRAQKEAELAQKRAEKEAQKAAEKAEREAKKAQEKAEREAKKAQEKAEKDAQKAAKLAEKEAKKKTRTNSNDSQVSKTTEDGTEETKENKVEEEQPKKVTVTRVTIDGKKYLKSSTNILYDPDTKEEVGMYDPITKSIVALPEDSDEEEEEEEYDD
jgi:hypothetical protein